MNRLGKILTYLLSGLLVLLLISCAGGGTRGTGLGGFRIITGTIVESNDLPVEGATVTIVETGESDLSDQNGEFQIETQSENANLQLQVQKDDFDTTIEVNDLDQETNNLNLEISIETQENIASVSTLEVWARIVGECDQFFENRPRIRQSVAIREGGMDCTLKFFASGDFQRLERVPAVIEVRACSGGEWRRIAAGTTGVGLNSGAGQIDFYYEDNQENCLYRLRAPIEIPGVKPVKVFIDSFSFQNK